MLIVDYVKYEPIKIPSQFTKRGKCNEIKQVTHAKLNTISSESFINRYANEHT